MHGFLEKLGDLSWIGPTYADQGWVELSTVELETLKKTQTMSRLEYEKTIANDALKDPLITVGAKAAWEDYVRALDAMCLCPDFDCDPKFPPKPHA